MDENINTVESVLQVQGGIYIDECVFKMNSDVLHVDSNYELNYNRTITRIDDNTYRVSLRCNVLSADKKSIEIHARAVAIFSVDAPDPKTKNSLISKNTVAILFPYVRSQIALVTAQTGIPQVVIPIVNIASMFKDMPLPGEDKEE